MMNELENLSIPSSIPYVLNDILRYLSCGTGHKRAEAVDPS